MDGISAILLAAGESTRMGGQPKALLDWHGRALVEHHVELARGGVGMTTVAYCAASEDGRTFGDQLTLRSESQPLLKELTGAVHQAGAAASLQLGHCGFFTKVGPGSGPPLSRGVPKLDRARSPSLIGSRREFSAMGPRTSAPALWPRAVVPAAHDRAVVPLYAARRW